MKNTTNKREYNKGKFPNPKEWEAHKEQERKREEAEARQRDYELIAWAIELSEYYKPKKPTLGKRVLNIAKKIAYPFD